MKNIKKSKNKILNKLMIFILFIPLFSCSIDTSTPEKLGNQLFIAFQNDDIGLIKKIGMTSEEIILTAEKTNMQPYEINQIKKEFKNPKVRAGEYLTSFIEVRKKLINNLSKTSITDYHITDCYVKIEERQGIDVGRAIIKIENGKNNAEFILFEILKIYNGNWKLQDDIFITKESTIGKEDYIKYKYYEILKEK